jgi:hypothetical protein
MQSIPRSLLFTILLVGLALVGCSTQTPPEATPTPTATPAAVTATGNKDCVPTGTGNDTCDVTSGQVFDEDHGPNKTQHQCEPWDDTTAIHVTAGTTGPNKFKKIHIKGEPAHPIDSVTFEACHGSSGNPFPSAKKNGKDWESGGLGPDAKDGYHYRLIMGTKTASGKMKKSDPHIVVDGTGKNR